MNRKVRVLYATHEPNLTGASQSLLDLLTELNQDWIEPVVLLRRSGPLEGKLNDLGIEVVIRPYALSVKGPLTSHADTSKKLVNRMARWNIARYIHSRGIDIVHNNSLLSTVGMEAARLAGIPYVCHVRELLREDHSLASIDSKAMLDLMNNAATRIYISDFVRAKFEDLFVNNRYYVLHNGINIDKYSISTKSILKEDTCRVLLPGRFAPGKGQYEALLAIESLLKHGVNTELLLIGSVGDTSYYSKCINYVKELDNSHIRVKEFTEDIVTEYRRADICLMCSHAEAMGRTTIEGMLSGCLVIGANAGATAELVRDGVTGILYKVGDSDSLAAKIAWAIEHPEAAQRIAKQGHDYAIDNYDNREYANNIVNIYKTLVE